jgi:flagellar hook-length control protein FliK
MMNDIEFVPMAFGIVPQTAVIPALTDAPGGEEFLVMLKNALAQLGEEKAMQDSEKSETADPEKLSVSGLSALNIVDNKALGEILPPAEKNSFSETLHFLQTETLNIPIPEISPETGAVLSAANRDSAGDKPSLAAVLSIEERLIVPGAVYIQAEEAEALPSYSEEFINHYKEVLERARDILKWLKSDDETESANAEGNDEAFAAVYKEETETAELSSEDLLEVFPVGAENTPKPQTESGFFATPEEKRTVKTEHFQTAKSPENAESPVKQPVIKDSGAEINFTKEKTLTDTLTPKSAPNVERLNAEKLPAEKLSVEKLSVEKLPNSVEVKFEAAKNPQTTANNALNNDIPKVIPPTKETAQGTDRVQESAEKKTVSPEFKTPEKEAAVKPAVSQNPKIAENTVKQNKTAAPELNNSELAASDDAPEEKGEPVRSSDTPESGLKGALSGRNAEKLPNAAESRDKGETSLNKSDITGRTEHLLKSEGKDTPKPAAAEKTLEWQSPKDAVKFAQLIRQTGDAGANKLTVRLIPEHLGKVEIQLTEINGRLDAKILANSMESKNFLAANADAIAKQLAEKGITIDNMDFSFHDSLAKDAREKSGREREGRASKAPRVNAERAEEKPDDAVETGLYA